MAESKVPTGSQEGDFYPPPPPGPPPGHNGLAMHPNEQPIPDSRSELYDIPTPPPSTTVPQSQNQAQTHTQQTPHQVPPPDSDGAPKKAGWGQRFSTLGSKAAAPLNMLATKLGSETFLPSTMDKEVEKAARILKSFCSKYSSHYLPSTTRNRTPAKTLSPEDGIYTDATSPETVEVPTTDADGKPTTAPAKPKKNRTLLTIPSKVINRAVGLAIFTTARMGFHVSGATGSGIIVARLPDGSWSPPSGIQVHSVGAGFMIGLDIYDCVVVINTREALEAFTKTRMSLGSDLAVVAGPWGAGGSVDFAAPQGKGKGNAEVGAGAGPTDATKDAAGKTTSPPSATDEKTPSDPAADPTIKEPTAEKTSGEHTIHPTTGGAERPTGGAKERKPSALKKVINQPTYSYVKSRGFYAGVQVDGTIVTERKDANTAFYGEPASVQQILKGEVPLVPGKEKWVNDVKPLFDTIKGAEGWHAQQSRQGEWANQMGPDPNSTYGFGAASENPPPKPPRPTPRDGGAGDVTGATAGVAAMNLGGGSGLSSTAEETPGARQKAAEAAAEAQMAREYEERERREAQEEAARANNRASTTTTNTTAPPGYSAMAGPGEMTSHNAGGADGTAEQAEQPPPAYVDEGTARPGVGDTKGGSAAPGGAS